MAKFNEILKMWRKRKDLTQEQLAEYAGVSPQAVSRWETGATCPDISVLPLLAELFGITVDELLGVNEREKRREINEIVAREEARINRNIVEEPIRNLREALNRYPNNDRLLCCLMYALYAASEDEKACREYDGEIISIADRIRQYSLDDDCRNEARRLLFRHYCDTGRKAEALRLADGMAGINTCLERNLYWALEEKDRAEFLKERIRDDMNELLWDIWAYSVHGGQEEERKAELELARTRIENTVKKLFCFD